MKNQGIETDLFCHQYWKNRLKYSNFNRKTRVQDAWDLTDVNCRLLYSNLGSSDKKIIKRADKEFKLLKPIEKNIILWRGINEPNNIGTSALMNHYNSSFSTKVGDRVHFREYSYAAANIDYPKFMAGKNGILYEIKVPKGSRLSRGGYYIFPRYSVFKCTNVKDIIEVDNSKLRLINLEYIKPKEINNFKRLISKMFHKLLRIK